MLWWLTYISYLVLQSWWSDGKPAPYIVLETVTVIIGHWSNQRLQYENYLP